MIETTLNGCISKIIFINIAALEYYFVMVDYSMMLDFVKGNTSISFFLNNFVFM